MKGINILIDWVILSYLFENFFYIFDSYRVILLVVNRNGDRCHQLVAFEASFFPLFFLEYMDGRMLFKRKLKNLYNQL